ncbi:MAG: HIT family hydrolase, partial [Caulobacteraceae bacterium]
AHTRLLVLSADDGLAPGTDALIAAIRHDGGAKVTAIHVSTDHSWSDERIRLESEVIDWLATLPGAPRP